MDRNTFVNQNMDQITPVVQVTDLQATYPQAIDPQPTQVKIYGKELVNLAKLYTDESKYSSENDNFDFKLTIFMDLC